MMMRLMKVWKRLALENRKGWLKVNGFASAFIKSKGYETNSQRMYYDVER
jgi:hypothetical protein